MPKKKPVPKLDLRKEKIWPWSLSDEEFKARYAHLDIDLRPLFEPTKQAQRTTEQPAVRERAKSGA